MIKEEIKTKLTDLGIVFDEDASKADLEALLPAEEAEADAEEGLKEEEIKTKPESGDREARWEAFLASYQASNPVKFASKQANGEFESIPGSFR